GELLSYRHALSKLLNTLSWGRTSRSKTRSRSSASTFAATSGRTGTRSDSSASPRSSNGRLFFRRLLRLRINSLEGLQGGEREANSVWGDFWFPRIGADQDVPAALARVPDGRHL